MSSDPIRIEACAADKVIYLPDINGGVLAAETDTGAAGSANVNFSARL